MSSSSPAVSTSVEQHSRLLRVWRSKAARRVLLALEVLLAVAVLATLIAAIALRHDMQASLPQLDGDLHIGGLAAPVTVTRDDHGVPALTAESLDDLLFAQGYVTAQDRLFQMDALRRHAAGELAEILGPSLVEHDRLQRYLRLRATAERAVATLPSDQLHQLEAYSRGVNAFIATHDDAHHNTLPIEFHLLHYHPAPWSPRDSLLVGLAMSQDLSTSFPDKLHREALAAHLPPELVADLYPVGSWRDMPPRQTDTDLTAPRPEIYQIPLDRSQSRMTAPSVTPQALLAVYSALHQGDCDACRAGSNDWVVAGSRSASGAPLLSDDMHLSLTVPDIWYEAALHLSDHSFDVTGFTLPGVPFVIAGRNAHVAWGFTNTGADVQDLLIEHLRGSGMSTEFERLDGSWALAAHYTEIIRVRGGDDISLDLLTTNHAVRNTFIETPVLSPLYPGESRALALEWNAYDPANITMPFFSINSAKDGASLVAAFAGLGGPSQNLVYADAHHIGYHALGRIPIRGPAVHTPRPVAPAIASSEESGDEDDSAQESSKDVPPPAPLIDYTIGSPICTVPIDALDTTQVWSGYIPYSDLPQVLDPASGVIATANARITPDDYPYFFSNDWADPYRVERIHRLLDGRTGLTPADMLRIQTDVHSSFDRFVAQRLAYALDHASAPALRHDARRLHQAADLLRDWNGEVSGDSPAAAIAVAARAEIWPLLLTAQIRAHDGQNWRVSAQDLAKLYTWGERNTALEELLLHMPARWLPAAFASWNDVLTDAVELGLQHGDAPGDLSRWRYGNYHPVEIAHPILGSHSLLSLLLGVRTGSGEQPAGGDGTTVKQTAQHFGPSERLTADLADAESTRANITTGEAGNPASPWYLDQFPAWLNGSTFALPLQNPAIAHTLRLLPQ
jgi:penicillin amidase